MHLVTRTSAPLSAVFLPGLGLVVGVLLSGCAGKDAPAPTAPVALAEVGAATEVRRDGHASDGASGLEAEEAEEAEEVEEVDELRTEDTDRETGALRGAEGSDVAEPVQEITFEGEDADPGLATEVRSAPKRPTLPSFRLFGTRSGDGP